jgi:hypothetical protein
MNWPSSIKIISDHPHRLVLNADFRRIEIDKRLKSISINGRPVTSFDAIESIDLKFCRGDKGTEWWTVHLNLGRQSPFRIGKSHDDLEASTAAARLSSITGKQVCALR